jgi:hypothetical protein
MISNVLQFLELGSSSEINSIIEGISYVLLYYEIYTLFCVYGDRYSSELCLETVYKTIFLFCVLSIISVIIVGTDNNSNSSVYIFGNKFSTSYLFIFLIGLFGATHDMENKKNKIYIVLLNIFTILLAQYLGCTTGVVISGLLLLILIVPFKLKKILANPIFIVCLLIFCGYSFMIFSELLKVEFVNNLVYNFFDKTTTIYGRIQIYDTYLIDILRNKLIFGYGYNSEIMYKISDGMFSNAQNGLMDEMIAYGLLGVVNILFIVYYCVKKANFNKSGCYLCYVLAVIIFASIVEITLGWIFYLVLFLIRCSKGKR